MAVMNDRLLVEFQLATQPIPKGRPRFAVSRGGRPRTYTPEETRVYEAKVYAAARAAMIRARATVTDKPVAVELVFRLTGGRRPDVDNLAKAVLDAMNGIVFHDDRQVGRLTVERHVRCQAGQVHARVYELESGKPRGAF